VHEIKHDGYRMIVRRDGAIVRLRTRNAVDYTDRLPAIATAAARLKVDCFTIDGEAVVIGPDGLTDFEALRRRGSGDVAVLYAFDLLEYDGNDLRSVPLETRRFDQLGRSRVQHPIGARALPASIARAGIW
jgi:ATP-dependent DNA ligase